MPRLLINGEHYDPVAPGALFEADYERLLVTNSTALYPGFHTIKFKCSVDSEHGTAQADLAIVRRTFTDWWVVEVELGTHPLSHVESQVRRLAAGSYGQEHADYIAANSPELDRASLRQMMRGSQPRVLVLVDQPKPQWLEPLSRLNALLGIVQVFRSIRGVEVLRINGQHPDEEVGIVSRCRVDPVLTRSLVVDAPAALGLPDGATVSIFYQEALTQWRVVGTKDRVWLMPMRRWPLPEASVGYALIRDRSGRLCLEMEGM